MSVTFPQYDESVIKLKNAKDLAARLNITGRDVYQMARSFNVLEAAANNEGAGGQMMGLGVGLGAGMGESKAYLLPDYCLPLCQYIIWHISIITCRNFVDFGVHF